MALAAPIIEPPPQANEFAEAREVQWLWKTVEMQRMARAIVGLALERAEFAADDLPAEMVHGGTGIAGSIMALLVNNGVIRRVGLWRGQEFYGKERPSKREGRKDAKLKVFEVADRRKAEAFLRRDKHQVRELTQGELIAAN